MIPERCLRAELYSPSNIVVPRERRAHPARIGTVQECPECGQTLALETRTTHLTGLTRRSGCIERGVETQSGNEGDRMSHRLTEVEQVEGSIAAVGDHHDVSVGQPAAQLEYHLSRPIGDLLMGFADPEVVAFGGSERCHDRQSPGSMRPGNVSQPHQAYPAQTGGLDQMGLAGTHCVSVDAPGLDSSAPSPLDRLVYAEHQRLITLCEMLDHKQ